MDEQLQKILHEQLRDVHLPEAISWWPLSIGWWFLIGLALCVLSYALIRILQHLKRNRYRKLASRELRSHFKIWQSNKDASSYIQSANDVLKRCVISFQPMAAKISGKPWTDILDLHSKTPFSEQTKIALAEAAYQAMPNIDVSSVHQELCQWLSQHTREAMDV